MNDLGKTPSTPHHGPSDSSTVDLVTGLVADARDLAQAHVDGLRIEARAELSKLGSAIRFGAIGLALFSIAALLAALGAAHALEAFTALPLWASYLIAALVFVGIGGALVAVARQRKQRADLVPRTELEHIKRDARWIARRGRDVVA